MNEDEEDPQFKHAQVKVHEALQALAELWGPRICTHGDFADCDECNFSETTPAQGSMLSEFVAVATWTNLTTGKSHMTWITPPNQLVTHTQGLLFTALYE